MKPNPELKKFIAPYVKDIQKLTLELRDYITDLVPEANELIWDNYNAVAMAYSKSKKLKDAFCHIAVYSHHVNFGFNRGAELTRAGVKTKRKRKADKTYFSKRFPVFPKTRNKKYGLGGSWDFGKVEYQIDQY